jgi:hypothetical protein
MEMKDRQGKQNPRLLLACKQQSYLALSMSVSALIGVRRINRAKIEICQISPQSPMAA